MVSELIRKYIYLIQIFIKAGENGLTLAALQSKWESKWGEKYSRRTFNNHREAVGEIFGIEIECNRSLNSYFVRFGSDAVDTDQSVAWLVNTFTVNDLLSMGRERLTGRVSVQNIPSGQKWLTSIMDAMLESHVLRISYKKYTGQQAEDLHVHPYGVREFGKRWYLVGFCRERNALRVYGLDRILSMEETWEVFKLQKDFDIDGLFHDSYGVYLPEDGTAVEVEIRTTETESRYLRDLPLHASQRLVTLDNGNPQRPVTFSLRLIPNFDFIQELVSRGGRIEVVSPLSLRKEVASEFEKAIQVYRNE